MPSGRLLRPRVACPSTLAPVQHAKPPLSALDRPVADLLCTDRALRGELYIRLQFCRVPMAAPPPRYPGVTFLMQGCAYPSSATTSSVDSYASGPTEAVPGGRFW